MGVVIESLTTASGLVLSNCYLSFGRSRVSIGPNMGIASNTSTESRYTVTTSANIWKDQPSRDQNMVPVDRHQVRMLANSAQIDQVYQTLYSSVGNTYGNVVTSQ